MSSSRFDGDFDHFRILCSTLLPYLTSIFEGCGGGGGGGRGGLESSAQHSFESARAHTHTHTH